jgi:lipopolysaccharide export system permease protein
MSPLLGQGIADSFVYRMRILTRYVLFDLLKLFLLTLTGLTLLIFVVLVGKEFVDNGVGLWPLLRMTPYLLPQAMQFAVPGTMLLATTSVYGRMASYNEIVAIKALGISPIALVWPTLALAAFVSFAAVWINNLAVSWGAGGVRQIVLESMEEIIYGQLRMRHEYNFGKANIIVRKVEGRTLIDPMIVVQASGDQPALTFSADEAELRLLPDEGKLIVRFKRFDIEGPFKVEHPDTYEHVLLLDELMGTSSKTRSPSNYALAEIGTAIEEQKQLVRRVEQSMTAQAAFGLMTGNFEALSKSAWQVHERELEGAEYRLHRLYTEPWRRWANGFSCLCFVMIGVPVAVWLRYSEFIASFFVCFLPILLVYYPLLAVSVEQAKDGTLPPQSVWLGNLILALAGVWLMRRVNRH